MYYGTSVHIICTHFKETVIIQISFCTIYSHFIICYSHTICYSSPNSKKKTLQSAGHRVYYRGASPSWPHCPFGWPWHFEAAKSKVAVCPLKSQSLRSRPESGRWKSLFQVENTPHHQIVQCEGVVWSERMEFSTEHFWFNFALHRRVV